MTAAMRRYQTALILMIETTPSDYRDTAEQKAAKKHQNLLTEQLMKRIRADGLTDLLMMGAGPWKQDVYKRQVATVGPNYHISVERMNDSVPFEYIKQKVDVRLTKATVEVFYGGNRICSHPKLYGRFNQYSTCLLYTSRCV